MALQAIIRILATLAIFTKVLEFVKKRDRLSFLIFFHLVGRVDVAEGGNRGGREVSPYPHLGYPIFTNIFPSTPSLSKTRKKIFPSPGIENKTSRCKKIKIEKTSYKKSLKLIFPNILSEFAFIFVKKTCTSAHPTPLRARRGAAFRISNFYKDGSKDKINGGNNPFNIV